MPGTYKRTAWQRKKAAKAMKKYWANVRRSNAHKQLVAERKAAGITTHTNGRPYKDMVAQTVAKVTAPKVIASKPIELLISISIIGDKTNKSLNVVSLVPSQTD